MHMIDTVTAAEVDRDIAEGVLGAEKRAERIARRRAKWTIAIARWTPMGVIGQGGVCIEPATRFQVYLQYGSSRCTWERFEGVPVTYVLEVSCERPLDSQGLDWVVRRVQDLRRDLAPDLRIDVKHTAARLNPELVQILGFDMALAA